MCIPQKIKGKNEYGKVQIDKNKLFKEIFGISPDKYYKNKITA